MKIPKIGDKYFDEEIECIIIEVEHPGQMDGGGSSVAIRYPDGEEIWMDCFWSEQHQRFQYFPDEE